MEELSTYKKQQLVFQVGKTGKKLIALIVIPIMDILYDKWNCIHIPNRGYLEFIVKVPISKFLYKSIRHNILSIV